MHHDSLVRLQVQDSMSGEKEYNIALRFTGGLCLIMTNIVVIIFRFYYNITTLQLLSLQVLICKPNQHLVNTIHGFEKRPVIFLLVFISLAMLLLANSVQDSLMRLTLQQ